MTEGTDLVLVDPSAQHVDMYVAKDIKKKLGRKTPREYLRSRPGPFNPRLGRRVDLTYAPWGYAARVMNDTFGPAWSFEYDPKEDVQKIDLSPLPAKPARGKEPGRPETQRVEVMVTGTLITPFGRQTATASRVYFPTNDQQLYGDVVAGAASTAFRRAASRLGVALDLSIHDDVEGLANADAADTTLTRFKEVCGNLGLTVASAITLLSTQLTGDPEGLTELADVVEACGGLESTIAALTELAQAVADQPIEPDEILSVQR